MEAAQLCAFTSLPWALRASISVALAAQEGGTAVIWVQVFEDSALAGRIRHIVEPANEQNLDRLAAVLAEASS